MADKRDSKRDVTLYVGDKNIPLNPFTQDILSEININLEVIFILKYHQVKNRVRGG